MTEEEAPSLSANRRQIALLSIALGLICAVLVALYWFVLRKEYAVLYSDLRPAQAAAIVSALEAEGVEYRIAAGGSEIQAPADAIDALRVRLAGSGAPLAGVDGFELFNESDMGLTDFAQKIRYQRAIQGELARTIMMMQGVAEARVHVSIPERSLFRGERRSAEAAVTLIMVAGEEASPERIEGVQRLVAASVTDMAVSDVVVLNGRGEIISSRVSFAGTPRSSEAAGASADFMADVIRLAIPHRRFEVRVEESPAPLAGAQDADSGADAPPRQLITISTESSLTADERARVRAELENAGVLDGSSRQLIAFHVEPVAPDAFETADAQSVPIAAAPPAHEAPSPWRWVSAALVFAFALAVAVIAVLAWRRARRPTLSFDQHRELAERLQAQLAGGGGGNV